MKKFRHLRQESTMVPQWLHKMVMAPKMKKLVRAYLNWRKKNPGQGKQGVMKAIQMMGLDPRDGNQLIDTLNDLVSQGKLPKHLAIAEEAKYDYGTPESVKLMKKLTPGQNEQMKPTSAQIRMARRLRKHNVGQHDDYYLSKMDPETRKKYEPAKRPPPAKINKPTGSFKWFATRDMKEGSESWEAGYKRRVVKTTKPEHKEKGYNWRIKGKDRAEISIKLYKEKPSQAEFNKQMKRVAGHEFGG